MLVAGRKVGAVKPVVVVVAVLALAAASTAGTLRVRQAEVHQASSNSLVVTLAVYVTVVFGLSALVLGDASGL